MAHTNPYRVVRINRGTNPPSLTLGNPTDGSPPLHDAEATPDQCDTAQAIEGGGGVAMAYARHELDPKKIVVERVFPFGAD